MVYLQQLFFSCVFSAQNWAQNRNVVVCLQHQQNLKICTLGTNSSFGVCTLYEDFHQNKIIVKSQKVYFKYLNSCSMSDDGKPQNSILYSIIMVKKKYWQSKYWFCLN